MVFEVSRRLRECPKGWGRVCKGFRGFRECPGGSRSGKEGLREHGGGFWRVLEGPRGFRKVRKGLGGSEWVQVAPIGYVRAWEGPVGSKGVW